MAIGFRTSGMFGPRPQQAAPMVAPNPSAMPIGVQQMTKKPKFFSKDGLAPVVLAGISDFFARQNGDDQNMLGDMVAAKQQMAMQEEDARIRAQLAQQQQQRQRENFLYEENYKRANPMPRQPDQITQYMLNAGIDPKSPEGQAMYRKALENKVNPPVWRQGADGGFYRVDTPQGGYDPVTDDEWNSASPMGGSGGNVTGGFR